jgi:CDP-4-dehydro-6-deoxyglucose reductase, E3
MATFRVTLRPSGRAFDAEADRNILQSALDAGVALPYSCRTGNCRTCRAKIVSGQVDHAKTKPEYLAENERAAGFALLCQARPQSDLNVEASEIAGFESVQPKILPCRVVRIVKPARDVAVIELRLPPNDKLRFMAGQYVEFVLDGDKRRAYSIATPPKIEGVILIELHIRHTPGGLFTDRVFSSLKERDLMKIEAPFGTFVLRENDNAPIVFLAAGTGFAPVKAIIEDALRKGVQNSRPMVLYWGARIREDLYMLDLPQRWAAEEPNFRFVPVLSEAPPESAWTGRTGFVHRAVMEDLPDLARHEVYACGTPLMVEAAKRDFFASCGLREDAFFADEFLTEAERQPAVLSLENT